MDTKLTETIGLSATAVALLRFQIKGWRRKAVDQDLAAYLELVEAGIMEPVPGSDLEYRFTEYGRSDSDEILEAAIDHLTDLEPQLPAQIELSEEARELLRRRVAGGRIVTDANRPVCRELVRAGIMIAVSGSASGPEADYHFTAQGWRRRQDWMIHPDGSP